MQRTLYIVAALLIVAGATFIGQGLGILKGSSFMVGDPKWAVIGTVLLVVGIGIALTARRRPAV